MLLNLWCLFYPTNSSAKSSNGSAFEIISYDLEIKVEPATHLLSGLNRILLRANSPLSSIRLDLFRQLKVHEVLFKGRPLAVIRDTSGFVVDLPKKAGRGDTLLLEIHYSGSPLEAKKAPWDGGLIWSTDSSGKPWIGVACEGIGASCWMPCKDGWNDEPESIKVKLIVPPGLTGVSNGRLKGQKRRPDGFSEFDWEVLNPINHYDITFNVGDFAHIEDVYVNASNQQLSLDYYVLKPNVSKAKTHFQQVKRMMQAFESYFGPYPFYKDGYKLVETPYWGMEHQSCVAYGNNYKNNNFGFDFIIIHESGHEWFANSLTASDKADMWLHEGFTTYSEALYVEKQMGLARSVQYLLGQKPNIKNLLPLIGPSGVNFNRGDNDCYYKGTWVLHSMRNILGNDTLWFNSLKDLSAQFRHRITTSAEVEKFLCTRTHYDFRPFFNQYLRHPEIPGFEYYLVRKDNILWVHFRLASSVKRLKLPVKVTLAKGRFDFVEAKSGWQVIELPYSDESDFQVDEKSILIQVKKITK